MGRGGEAAEANSGVEFEIELGCQEIPIQRSRKQNTGEVHGKATHFALRCFPERGLRGKKERILILLLLLAVIAAAWILFPKPFILRKLHSKV
ncbi:hypothetical protein Nepgr_017955 [Nepenthes gracilis]|uniref:Uncharacterized protein n=1 Tax=Nepenthes gracilis TaxID=150966 RepID=A0AAD3SSJ8_NEPGR|nr:hypothetical protein Nepgr_017955 [Nepenthes gracilis]